MARETPTQRSPVGRAVLGQQSFGPQKPTPEKRGDYRNLEFQVPQAIASVFSGGINRPSSMADTMPSRLPRLVPHLTGERIEVRDGWLSFLAVGEQTGGAYALIETANDPNTGVRLHVHEREDETWLVLEGEYVFQVGDRTFHARPGDYVFGPRSVPHRYGNQTQSLARALIMVTPAGFEGFWRESARLGSDLRAHEALGQKYGVKSL